MVHDYSKIPYSSSLVYGFSRLFERSAYYGYRAILVLFMVGETLNFSNEKALKIYGWFMGALVFSRIAGALFGDLLLGNKRAMIVGGSLQVLAGVVLCFSFDNAIYVSAGLLVLGCGFYTPNNISQFGKAYFQTPRFLDSGFTFFYLMVNLGALLGPLVIGYLFTIDHRLGFGAVSVAALLSIGIPFFYKEEGFPERKVEPKRPVLRIFAILAVFALTGLFWFVYDFSAYPVMELKRVFDLKMSFESSMLLLIPVSIVATLLWAFLRIHQFIKIGLGFLVGALAFASLLIIPENPANSDVFLLFVYGALILVSEILIAPIVLAVIAKYSPPKFLATFVSFYYAPLGLLLLVYPFQDFFQTNPNITLKIASATMFGLGMLVLIGFGIKYLATTKKR